MSENSINVNIGGDVSGVVNIAGRDLIITQVTMSAPVQRYVPPSPPPRLIGRATQYRAILDSIATGQPVLLHGMGGMGKTSLAQAIAADAFANADRYPGGILWITVLGQSLESLCDHIFRLADDIESVKLPAGQKPALVRQRLGNQRLMVVLDDVDEDNPAAQDWLRDVHPVSTPLVVTSRKMQPKFKGFDITELDRADAIALLRHHAETVREKLTDDLAGEICAASGDHPLAVEIMGALLNSRTMELSTIVQDLEAAHTQVRNFKTGDTKDRNVYASLELSWQRLDKDQRLVLGLLAACFAPSTSDGLLSSICQLDSDRYRSAKSGLFSQSLMREQKDRWSVHGLVTVFVHAALGDAGWDVVRRLVVHGCVQFASEHNSHSGHDRFALQQEQQNLFESVIWSAAHSMDTEVTLLVNDLYMSSDFLRASGFGKQAITLLELAITSAKNLQISEVHAMHLSNLGNIYDQLGDYERSMDFHKRGLEIMQTTGQKPGEADILGNMGNLYRSLGIPDEAISCYQRQIELGRATGYLQTVARGLGNLGNIYADLGRDQDAIKAYYQQLEAARQSGERYAEAAALGNLGLLHLENSNAKAAINLINEQLSILRNDREILGEGIALINLANAYIVYGSPITGAISAQLALEILEQCNAPSHLASGMLTLANARIQQRITDGVEDLCKSAALGFENMRQPLSQARAVAVLGQLYELQKQQFKALEAYQQAYTLFQSGGAYQLAKELETEITRLQDK